jgi:chromosome segregation ATPase
MAPVLAAKVAELESFQINYHHATCMEREEWQAKVAELTRELEDLNKKHDIAWSNWKTSGAKVAELERENQDLRDQYKDREDFFRAEGERIRDQIDASGVAALQATIDRQAATIERLTAIARELVDANVEEFGPSRYNTAMNKARAELGKQEQPQPIPKH